MVSWQLLLDMQLSWMHFPSERRIYCPNCSSWSYSGSAGLSFRTGEDEKLHLIMINSWTSCYYVLFLQIDVFSHWMENRTVRAQYQWEFTDTGCREREMFCFVFWLSCHWLTGKTNYWNNWLSTFAAYI